ncbi:MAG: diguanylate cyclase domain-containing protein, partial [Vibrio sp.]
YYVSRYSDYTFIYDSYYSSERMSNFKDSFIRNDFNRIDDPETLFWVSKAHVSAYDQKTIISFVKNITNEYNNVIGFLTRSFEVEDIDAIANRTIWKDNLTSNMLQEGQLVILNHNSEIYRTPATETNTSHHGVFHFIASEKKLNASLFGTFDIEYELPYTNLVYVLLVENVYLLLVPFILYLILYLLSLQLLKSLRESDKQNFDAMTGIYNRQGFEQKVKPKVKKQIAQNKTAHILAIDANKFKQINDKYGHETGDQAIRVIADSAKKITHDEDDVIRLGGDEFLIILYIANNIEFSADEFLHSLNRKISYECKARSIPLFTVTAGHVAYNLTSNASFNVLVKQADKILLDKKWIDKIDVINQGFRNYNIHLSDDESLQKLAIAKRLDFINAEHKLQSELNSDVISVYRHDLNYLMSNYFQLIYADDQDNRLLHRFRMNIVESHHQSDVSMSIFYFLLTKYSGFLGRQIHLTDDEERIYNRLIAYEIYYISSLHMR